MAIRRYSVRSSALWWVVNGRAERAAVDRLQHRRLDLDEALRRRGSGGSRVMTLARVMNSSRASSLAIRSSSRWR